MPELPEVETVRRGLATVIEGDTIDRVETRRKDLRFPFPPRFAARLAGRRIVAIDRRAKYLLFRLDDGDALLAHLGMSGSFRVTGRGLDAGIGMLYRSATKDPAHDHVVFHMRSGVDVLYNDPRRFGLMDIVPGGDPAASRHLRRLGLEPLGNQFNAVALAAAFAGKRTPLKAALLDQHLVAGLGNIYVCEALWRARLRPTRAAGTLVTKAGAPTVGAERLAAAIRDVLDEAIAVGGSSLRDHIQANGEIGAFQTRFAVYDREGEACPRPGCHGIVRRAVHGGRSTFSCGTCQR